MNGDSYNTESETERCPECGKPIVYGHYELMGYTHAASLECPCVTEKHTRERAARILKGRGIVRDSKREAAGLRKRAVMQRFRNFKPDNGQQEAFAAAREFAKEYIEGKNTGTGLLLIGGVGSGKSHLAAAVINAAIDYIQISNDMADKAASHGPDHIPYSGIRFVGTVALLEQLRASFNDSESAQDIIRRYQESKLLVLDDLGADKPSEWALERLFDIVDYRYNECTPVIITTNANINELRGRLGDRICDRIRSMCTTYTVTSRSHRATANNAQPEAGDGNDFDDPPAVYVKRQSEEDIPTEINDGDTLADVMRKIEEADAQREKTIWERMRE